MILNQPMINPEQSQLIRKSRKYANGLHRCNSRCLVGATVVPTQTLSGPNTTQVIIGEVVVPTQTLSGPNTTQVIIGKETVFFYVSRRS